MSGKQESNPTTPTAVVRRWLAPLLVAAVLVSATGQAGDSGQATAEPILYEIYLVEANEPVIALSNDAVLRAAKGDLDGLINVPGADTGTLRERLQVAEEAGALRSLAAPRILTELGRQTQAQTGIQLPIQTRIKGKVSSQYINATLRVQLTTQRSRDGLLNLEVRVQKQLPLFDMISNGPGQSVPIKTVDQVAMLVVHDRGTAVLSGFRTILRDGTPSQIPELVLLVTPAMVEL